MNMTLHRNALSGRSTAVRIGGAVIGAALIAGAAFGVGTGSSAHAATNTPTSNLSTDGSPIHILLGVGATEAQRIASWYVPSNVAQSLEIEKSSDLTDGAFNASKTVVAATTKANTSTDTSTTDSDTKNIVGITAETGYANAHATITGLQPNTTYTYHVGNADGSAWSQSYTFSTKSFTGDFDFLFFGDPQIGSSSFVDDDGAGWAATLAYATSHTPNAELLVSGGDQIEHANNEYEWGAFADSSDVLKRYPWAATIGNHDVGGKSYEQHNTVPNSLRTPDFYPGGATTTMSGGDYWYIYKGVLFIDINSNAYSGGADAEHVAYVRDVINRHGADAKWTALVYHHSIYSPADHANDIDNQQRRFDFTKAFSDLGVDIVLQGHDHSYTRSYSILNGKKANAAEQPAAPEVFAGPGGVIYVTANSASGSKYYDLTTPDATQSGYGPDPLDPTGQRHWANSVENQEHVRTYVKVSVTDDKLDVIDVRAGDCSAPNSAVVNGRVANCGVTLQPTASADPAPIGSLVDHFTLDAERPVTTTSLSVSAAKQGFGTSKPNVLTVKVAGGIGDQNGVVTFSEGQTVIGTAKVESGSASFALPSDYIMGRHPIVATFANASTFSGTGSVSRSVPVVVVKANSTTTIDYAAGKATVAVKSNGVGVTGYVNLIDNGQIVKKLKVVNGTVSYPFTSTVKGTHRVHAEFVTTGTISASRSATVYVPVK